VHSLDTNKLFNILVCPISKSSLDFVSEAGNKYLKDKNSKYLIKEGVPILMSDKNYADKDNLFKNSIQNFWDSGWNKRSKENDHNFLYDLTHEDFFNRVKKKYDHERSRGVGIGGYLSNEVKMENLKDKISLIIGPGCGEEAIELNLLTKSRVIGVDISYNSAFLTNKLFKNLDSNCGLGVQGDSRFLPIKSNSIDFVFSHGVIHHSPNIIQSINEIHRVLKPKGFFCVGLYNKHGFVWIKFLLNAFLKGNWSLKRMERYISSQTEKAWITEDNTNPYTKLFSKSECEKMFKLFNNVKVRTGNFKTPNNRLLKFLKLFENSKFLSKFGSMNYISGIKI
jgi:ubiquinone/menaquinone biosynthesis C-methylase UbiE/uncharacterized protein YbaR (Trm112 family)